MKAYVFQISVIQSKMDEYNSLRTKIKIIAAAILFMFFLLSFTNDDMLTMMWIASMISIVILFLFDSYYIKMVKNLEYELYELQVETLEKEKDVAKIRGDQLPDAIFGSKTDNPSGRLSLPYLYYSVLLILDLLIMVLIIL